MLLLLIRSSRSLTSAFDTAIHSLYNIRLWCVETVMATSNMRLFALWATYYLSFVLGNNSKAEPAVSLKFVADLRRLE